MAILNDQLLIVLARYVLNSHIYIKSSEIFSGALAALSVPNGDILRQWMPSQDKSVPHVAARPSGRGKPSHHSRPLEYEVGSIAVDKKKRFVVWGWDK